MKYTWIVITFFCLLSPTLTSAQESSGLEMLESVVSAQQKYLAELPPLRLKIEYKACAKQGENVKLDYTETYESDLHGLKYHDKCVEQKKRVDPYPGGYSVENKNCLSDGNFVYVYTEEVITGRAQPKATISKYSKNDGMAGVGGNINHPFEFLKTFDTMPYSRVPEAAARQPQDKISVKSVKNTHIVSIEFGKAGATEFTIDHDCGDMITSVVSKNKETGKVTASNQITFKKQNGLLLPTAYHAVMDRGQTAVEMTFSSYEFGLKFPEDRFTLSALKAEVGTTIGEIPLEGGQVKTTYLRREDSASAQPATRVDATSNTVSSPKALAAP